MVQCCSWTTFAWKGYFVIFTSACMIFSWIWMISVIVLITEKGNFSYFHALFRVKKCLSTLKRKVLLFSCFVHHTCGYMCYQYFSQGNRIEYMKHGSHRYWETWGLQSTCFWLFRSLCFLFCLFAGLTIQKLRCIKSGQTVWETILTCKALSLVANRSVMFF